MKKIVVIGGGVTGCAIARELSKYQYQITILEKESDICEGTSKANSGIIHAGFDALPGTLKAKMNVRGNACMDQLAKDLDIPFKRNGSLVLCFSEEQERKLEVLYRRGVENGVSGLMILSAQEVLRIEPNVNKNVVSALFAPTGGIVCPFGMTIAFAENACQNGVEILRDAEVTDIHKDKDGYQVYYKKNSREETVYADIVINAAGLYADKMHNMVSDEKLEIQPIKGEYILLDKTAGDLTRHTLFQLPTEKGKGVLVTPTVHGNMLIGPNAVKVEEKEAIQTTGDGMDEIKQKSMQTINDIPFKEVITSFAGIRAHLDTGDFLIKEVEDAKHFIDVCGIESPGLTSAPAIGEYVTTLVQDIYPAEQKKDFIKERRGIRSIHETDLEEWNRKVKEQPAYGHVICRCEQVTEGEILEAIHRPCGAVSVDGIKRRTRAGMGRCQSGFCLPKTMEILSRELDVPMESVTKHGKGSEYLATNDLMEEQEDKSCKQ